jgi:drug/metabolite transporter (DMT)-like permease
MYYFYSTVLVFGGLFIVNLIFSYQSKHIDPHFWTTLKFQLLMLPLFLSANICIGYGVKFGYKALGNLSYVLAASKGLEILISLIMGYIFLKEVPTWKTGIGLGIVVIGFVVAKLK